MKISPIMPADYPSGIRQLHDPPEQLWFAGEPLASFIGRPSLAVVGSRAVSPYGRHATETLVQALARAGVVIISGLALGVDSIAHQAALDANGQTMAVLPAGLERIYPTSHTNLSKHILDRGGTLVSEYSGVKSPMKHQFIARNRLIAGLADAILLTEAAERSGSLHTAQFALEAGKEVFAVPGNITSPGSAGVNNLIKSGATPVTGPKDLLDYFGLKKPQQITLVGGSKEEQAIYNLLQQGITSGIELLNKSKLSPTEFSQALTMLEITGSIRAMGGDNWRTSD